MIHSLPSVLSDFQENFNYSLNSMSMSFISTVNLKFSQTTPSLMVDFLSFSNLLFSRDVSVIHFLLVLRHCFRCCCCWSSVLWMFFFSFSANLTELTSLQSGVLILLLTYLYQYNNCILIYCSRIPVTYQHHSCWVWLPSSVYWISEFLPPSPQNRNSIVWCQWGQSSLFTDRPEAWRN